MNRNLLRLVLVAFTACFISIITIANRGNAEGIWTIVGTVPYGDKWGHLVLVGTLSLLLNSVWNGKPAPWRFHRVMFGSLLLAIVMTLEEGSQAFIPSRSCDGLDWLANMLGIAIGEWGTRRFLRKSSYSRQKG